MKKIKILLLAFVLIFAVSLTSCELFMGIAGEVVQNIVNGAIDDALKDHTCEAAQWEIVVDPTCSEEGEEDGYCVICEEYITRAIPKIDHTPENVDALAPTCTEEGREAGIICSECGEAIEGANPIAASGHTERIIPAVEATETTLGKTEGKECSVCGVILVYPQTTYSGAYTDPNKYDGDYAFKALAKRPNGDAMQSFYMEIDAAADAFHTSGEDALAASGYYYAAKLTFSDNGITAEQALTAWSAYTIDHPLYYWISKQVRYSEGGGYLNIVVDEDYVDADARIAFNAEIYARVKSYVEALNGESEIYEMAAKFISLVCDDADYAYLSDGVTPSNEDAAHNIIGVMCEGEGVCESYAKTFQLLLNYCEAECIFVTGNANGGPHAWNLVKLDNGEWYWYDLTWEDSLANGEYICQTDMDDHYPDAPGGVGTDFTYELPETAEVPYN